MFFTLHYIYSFKQGSIRIKFPFFEWKSQTATKIQTVIPIVILFHLRLCIKYLSFIDKKKSWAIKIIKIEERKCC